MSTTTRTNRQAEADARTDEHVAYAAAPYVLAMRMVFGWDGSSIDDAVEEAYTPTGPSREVIRAHIEFRRAHPHLLYPGEAQENAA